MGISFSSGRRNQNQNHQNHHLHHSYYNQPPPPPLPYYYSPTVAPSTPSDPSTLTPQLPPPPPPPQYYQYNYNYNYQYPPAQVNPNTAWYNNGYNNYGNRLPINNNFQYFNNNNNNNSGGGWGQVRVPPVTAPPYVEHQRAKVVKNDVNVHKDTIKLGLDVDVDQGLTSDHFLVSFVFDAHFDGSITIYYFAKEDKENLKFTPVFSTVTSPIRVPFEKGTAQRFQQPSGTGVDLGFFDLESLRKPTEDDVFPLVIFAEVNSSSRERDNDVQQPSAESSQRVQVTQAIIEKKNEGLFQVKVVKQILWIDGIRYELHDLYGIGNASSEGFNDDDPGKECVICLTEPKNTAVIPCRHLCLCSDCAKELRLQSNKCPICRQPITEFMEIKINNTE